MATDEVPGVEGVPAGLSVSFPMQRAKALSNSNMVSGLVTAMAKVQSGEPFITAGALISAEINKKAYPSEHESQILLSKSIAASLDAVLGPMLPLLRDKKPVDCKQAESLRTACQSAVFTVPYLTSADTHYAALSPEAFESLLWLSFSDDIPLSSASSRLACDILASVPLPRPKSIGRSTHPLLDSCEAWMKFSVHQLTREEDSPDGAAGIGEFSTVAEDFSEQSAAEWSGNSPASPAVFVSIPTYPVPPRQALGGLPDFESFDLGRLTAPLSALAAVAFHMPMLFASIVKSECPRWPLVLLHELGRSWHPSLKVAALTLVVSLSVDYSGDSFGLYNESVVKSEVVSSILRLFAPVRPPLAPAGQALSSLRYRWFNSVAERGAGHKLYKTVENGATASAPLLLSRLLELHPSLTATVMGNGSSVVRQLTMLAKSSSQRTAVAAFHALGLLCHDLQDASLADVIVGPVIEGLKSPVVGTRVAAADALRRLTRSVHLLKELPRAKELATLLVGDGVIGNDAEPSEPLALVDKPLEQAMPVPMLFSQSVAEQIAATGAVCNLVLHFSPVKVHVIPLLSTADGPVLRQLVRMCVEPNEQPMRASNAVWALRNLVFQAPLSLRANVARALGGEGLLTVIRHDSNNIATLGAALLRNLVWHSGVTSEMERGLLPEAAEAVPGALECLTRLVASDYRPYSERVQHLLGVVHNLFSFPSASVRFEDLCSVDMIVPVLTRLMRSHDTNLAVAAIKATWNIHRSNVKGIDDAIECMRAVCVDANVASDVVRVARDMLSRISD